MTGVTSDDATSDLLAAAGAWLDEDPDPATRDELKALLDRAVAPVPDAGALAELADRFAGPLEFGTAGLRGAMGAGPHRMNEVVVLRATAGLAAWLTEQGHRGRPVIVGFDARHRSADFAAVAASVLAAAGFPVHLAARPLPTPLVAFGVLHLGCCAGVQVTASHNPPRDNGYKVYVADGAQIVPPADTEIAAHIAAVGALDSIPRAKVLPGGTDAGGPGDPEGTAGIHLVGDGLVAAYVEGAVATALRSPDRTRAVRVVYTPMHGVGRDVVVEAFGRAGFEAPAVVAEQGDPDPDFPTVAFPNPEEPGALDLALDLARSVGADVVLANDPDADRLAVAVPTPDGWRPLSGDRIGILLADWLLSLGEGPDRMVVTTIVSSSMLGKLAAARGVGHHETLTGFKWVVRPALAHPEVEFVYGYEEALGSCVGSLVRDKDGIGAALAFAELVAFELARGRTVLDRLDDLDRELGVHATGQRSVPVPGADGLARMRDIVDRLAAAPPASVAGRPVTSVDDLRPGGRLPPTDAVVLRGDGVRLIVRPSGTEPKLKCYAEAVVGVAPGVAPGAGAAPGADLAAARAKGAATVDALLTAAVDLAT